MLVGIQQAGWAMSCYKILSTQGAKFFVSRACTCFTIDRAYPCQRRPWLRLFLRAKKI